MRTRNQLAPEPIVRMNAANAIGKLEGAIPLEARALPLSILISGFLTLARADAERYLPVSFRASQRSGS
jgi:hypothetical protein